ncbi:hypothetical protein HanRHA438_Chr17g0840511 [Helianthus annuus]|nr:hypothetical protein HanRHA438_Chr17g0840511 [Helianthus annuus]
MIFSHHWEQWRTHELVARGANERFNHIFKECGWVFICQKNTLIFFQRVRPPTHQDT